jgi:hypothetical protein
MKPERPSAGAIAATYARVALGSGAGGLVRWLAPMAMPGASEMVSFLIINTSGSFLIGALGGGSGGPHRDFIGGLAGSGLAGLRTNRAAQGATRLGHRRRRQMARARRVEHLGLRPEFRLLRRQAERHIAHAGEQHVQLRVHVRRRAIVKHRAHE